MFPEAARLRPEGDDGCADGGRIATASGVSLRGGMRGPWPRFFAPVQRAFASASIENMKLALSSGLWQARHSAWLTPGRIFLSAVKIA